MITNRVLAKVATNIGLSDDEIRIAKELYNSDLFSYDNEIYSSLAVRYVMYLNSCKHESWHYARQQFLVNHVLRVVDGDLMDIGFGVLHEYVFDFLNQSDYGIVLLDKYESASILAREVFSVLGFSRKMLLSRVAIRLADAIQLERIPDGCTTVILFDVVEHIPNPKGWLMKLVANSSGVNRWLVSLPIGPLIPSHIISFEAFGDIQRFLEECGLSVVSHKICGSGKEDEFDLGEAKFEEVMALCKSC